MPTPGRVNYRSSYSSCDFLCQYFQTPPTTWLDAWTPSIPFTTHCSPWVQHSPHKKGSHFIWGSSPDYISLLALPHCAVSALLLSFIILSHLPKALGLILISFSISLDCYWFSLISCPRFPKQSFIHMSLLSNITSNTLLQQPLTSQDWNCHLPANFSSLVWEVQIPSRFCNL